MKHKIQISIPEPCHEGWQNMTPVEKGRFCASCQKKVLDFTYLSDNEIIKVVTKNDNLCARIDVSNLNRNLIKTKTKSNYFGYFATTVLAFFGLGIENVVAQEKPVVEQTDFKYLNKATDSVKKIIVSGLVKNVYGQPLPGAIIKIKGTKNSTNTDQNGKYTIEVNQGEILIFSFLAKIDKEVLVRNSKIINVILHSGELLIGQVILK
ncbi:carboxypeptidase-like regulatory domain-containing protein [Flavobacterium sp.]|jgi:hypothetical protein|uniref:carboxypeptidase-like regulatory domain-containing protein n=1 Tax=Flavobacterium sp. TaxID=239 RepID=UPI0037BF4E68